MKTTIKLCCESLFVLTWAAQLASGIYLLVTVVSIVRGLRVSGMLDLSAIRLLMHLIQSVFFVIIPVLLIFKKKGGLLFLRAQIISSVFFTVSIFFFVNVAEEFLTEGTKTFLYYSAIFVDVFRYAYIRKKEITLFKEGARIENISTAAIVLLGLVSFSGALISTLSRLI